MSQHDMSYISQSTKAPSADTRGILQRAAINPTPVNDVPLVVKDMLGSYGQSLDTQARTFMEPCFGRDFGYVPVVTRAPITLQTKLTIGQVGDKYEQEADKVADTIMRMPAPVGVEAQSIGSAPVGELRRELDDEEEQKKKAAQGNEDEPLRRKESCVASSATHAQGVPPIVHEVIHSSGQSLNTSTLAFMESRFGHDFSHVRVHTDKRAAESARSVNALAYTVGSDVVFGAGQYAPTTIAGRRLLAHELTHTIQQRSPRGPVQQHLVQRTQEIQVGKGVASMTLVVGGLRFSKEALNDVMKGGALLPGADQAHIGFHGDLLGYDLNYTQPVDPFRWSKIKEIIDSDQKILVQKTSLGGPIKVLFITPKDRLIIPDNLKSLGLTLPTEALSKRIYPSEMFLTASPSADTHFIFYTTTLGTAADSSLAHELLGHLWLALKGVPFVHPNEQKDPSAVVKKGTLGAQHGIKDPFGNLYVGTVRNYIDRYIGSEGQVLKSPTQNVGQQLLRQAINAFKTDFVRKSSGILNGNWSVPNDVDLQWEIISKNFVLAPASATQGATSTSTPQAAPPSGAPAAPTAQPTPSGTLQGTTNPPTPQVQPPTVSSGPGSSTASQAVPTVTRQGIQQELTIWYATLNPDQQYVFIKYIEALFLRVNRETELASQLDKTLKRPAGMSSSSVTP